jgi:tetratricopeptide (TPR) repeat protein
MSRTPMARNFGKSPAARGFAWSLVLLVSALAVFLVVFGPFQRTDKGGEPERAVAAPPGRVAAAGAPAAMPAAPAASAVANAGGAAVAPAKALGAETGSADADVQKAITLIDNGGISEAVALLEGVLKRDPKNEQALVEMAMVNLLDLKQPAEAMGYLQRVMEINPSNQVVLSELVSLYEEQGKLDEGLSFLLEVSGKAPGSPEVSYGIGQLYALEGRDGDAIPYLEKATQSPENEVRAYRDLGEALARSGEADKALESYGKAIASQEKELADKTARGLPVQFVEERIAYTKMDMARVLISKGETEPAQQLLDEVKRIMPADESVTALQESLNRKKAG